nr:hypothetical protein GCM10025699_66990 [Microbacterium flavescens]
MQLVREVLLERAAVHHEGARTGDEASARDGLLATADGRARDVQNGAGVAAASVAVLSVVKLWGAWSMESAI